MDVGILRELILFMVPLLLSLSFHEASHAWAAHKLGDDTASLQGRLTLNPLAHIDVFGTIILPILMIISGGLIPFGYAKPVPVNSLRLRGDRRRASMLVSIMGPLSNLFLALICVLLLGFILKFSTNQAGLYASFSIEILKKAFYLNVVLGVFNLIPIPPLDGHAVLANFLPSHLADQFERLGMYGFVFLMVLFYTGILRYLMIPAQWIIALLLQYGSILFQENLMRLFVYG
ncbi:MAG: site-2 protease family protein [Deltaproteobacteria bacterium]|nr:site-2 protease family protein [Deltaproteobacteria bacterium]